MDRIMAATRTRADGDFTVLSIRVKPDWRTSSSLVEASSITSLSMSRSFSSSVCGSSSSGSSSSGKVPPFPPPVPSSPPVVEAIKSGYDRPVALAV